MIDVFVHDVTKGEESEAEAEAETWEASLLAARTLYDEAVQNGCERHHLRTVIIGDGFGPIIYVGRRPQ
jgi:hypothetical protein